MAGAPKKLRDERAQADKYGKRTALFVALVGMGIALADQVIAPNVTIDFRVYVLMAGVALGFYPKILAKIFDIFGGKK